MHLCFGMVVSDVNHVRSSHRNTVVVVIVAGDTVTPVASTGDTDTSTGGPPMEHTQGYNSPCSPTHIHKRIEKESE